MAAVKGKRKVKKSTFFCCQNWPLPLPPFLSFSLFPLCGRQRLCIYRPSGVGAETYRSLRPPFPRPSHLLCYFLRPLVSNPRIKMLLPDRTRAPIDDIVRNGYSAKEQDICPFRTCAWRENPSGGGGGGREPSSVLQRMMRGRQRELIRLLIMLILVP
jgi:hypothetical protein